MYVCDLLGERTGKPLQYSCLENAMNSMKRQKAMTLRAGEDLRVPWTARSSNESVLKEINSEYLVEGLVLKLQ